MPAPHVSSQKLLTSCPRPATSHPWKLQTDGYAVTSDSGGQYGPFKKHGKTTTATDYIVAPFRLMTSAGTPKVVALSHIRIAVLVSVDVQTAFGLASNQFCIEPALVQV